MIILEILYVWISIHKKLYCNFQQMVDLSKEIDFSKELAQDPSLEEFLKEAAKQIASEAEPESVQKPELDLELKSIVLVTGAPIATKEKASSLATVLETKILASLGIDKAGGLKQFKMGVNKDGSTNGSFILKYQDQQQALKAINQIHGKQLGPNTFSADFIKAAEDILNSVEEKYVEPNIVKREISQSYNVEGGLRDQLVYREGTDINHFWFDYMEKKPIRVGSEIPKIPNLLKMEWSPLGTYLVCYFSDGFSLHSGDKFQNVGNFRHNKVLNVTFSPDENYIVSFNGTVYAPDRDNFVVWEVKIGKKLRSFNGDQTQNKDSFKFSYDSKYIAGAFIHTHLISVFELPSMSMLATGEGENIKKSPIQVPNIQKFSWHTTKNLLICLAFAPVRDKTVSVSTTKIHVIEVPTRRQIKWKSWAYQAGNGQIVVSANGDWVAVVLQKIHKKRVISTVVQVASFKKKDLQIDMVEVPEKQVDVGFDIYNGRFAVVVCKEQTKQSLVKLFTATFFDIDQSGKDQSVKKIGEITNQNTNKVSFSNNGLFFVLYSVDRRGNFTTGYINKTEKGTNIETIKVNLSHAYMNYLEFDPSGKYLLLGSTDSKSIQIWTILGELIFRDAAMKPIGDAHWRPRLIKFLGDKEEKQLFDGWKHIKTKYQELDDRMINKIKYAREAQKTRLKTQFLAFIKKKKQFYKDYVAERERITGIFQNKARTKEVQYRERIEPITS